MMTCMPTRFLAPTGAHLAKATPWPESAPHTLDAARSLPPRTATAPPNGSAKVIATPFRAQSAASTHHEQLSIPILLPR
jgi:hypothetical protein